MQRTCIGHRQPRGLRPGQGVALVVLALAIIAGHRHADGGTPGESSDRGGWSGPSCAAAPLAEAIDALVERAAVGPVAAVCDDAAFLRRVHLDLAGTIPSPTVVRAFLADGSADKRRRVIDGLLASPACARRMALFFDALLLERRTAGGDAAAWREWLATAVAEDRPFDGVCAELIGTDGAEPATRPALTFQLVREVDPARMTRSIGRVFLGRDLECCQCHDHPDNGDLRQADYHALRAFLQRSSLFKEPKDAPALVGETARGEVDYTSVFTKETVTAVRPRVPAGRTLVDEPIPEPGDDYLAVPSKEARGVPVHSRRRALGRMVVASAEFPRVLANHLWAMLLGRGLVHPLDGHDPDNPPVHPDLLDLLAARLRDDGFRLRPLLCGIVLSRTYQRSVEPPPLSADMHASLDALISRLGVEEEAAEALIEPAAAARDAAAARWRTLLDADSAARAALAPRIEPRDTARRAADTATAATASATAEVAKKTAQGEALALAATQATAAAALLPDDKVLAGAAAIVAARSAEFAPVLDAAKAALVARVHEEEAVRAALEAARRELAAAGAARPATADLAAADDAALAAHDAWQGAVARRAALAARRSLAIDMRRVIDADAADPQGAALQARIDEQRTALGQIGRVRPLAPEPFALSLLTATGVMESVRSAAGATIEKAPPAVLQAVPAEAAGPLRDRLVELRAVEEKRALLGTVAGLYGDPLAGDFQASVNQALWLGNGPDVASALGASGGTLVERLLALGDAAVADELFVTVLSRPPDAAEAADVVARLKDRADDRAAAIAELVWGALASVEFRFNH